MAGITQYQPYGLPGILRSFVAKSPVAGFVATFPVSVLDQYRFPQIPYSFDAEHRAFLLDLQRCLSVPLTGDSFPGGIVSPVDVITRNNVKYYGAVGDGVTDDTAAITAALATGYDIYFPLGTYLTTGGHRISTTGQIIYGAGRGLTTIRKSTGTNYLIDTTHGVAFAQLKDMTFDGNSLGGSAVIWRAHYATIKNVAFKNQGGTDYALYLSGVNVSEFKNIMTYNECYGGILIDQSVDTYTPTPGYGCMYSNFENLILGETDGGSAIKLAGTQAQILFFKNIYTEPTNAAVPYVSITGSHNSNLYFFGLHCETGVGALTAPKVKIEPTVATTLYNIRFIESRFNAGGAQTQPCFQFIDVDGISIEKAYFRDPSSSGGRHIIEIQNCKNVSVDDSLVYHANAFYFIYDNGGNSYITDRGNSTRHFGGAQGAGTNQWDATSSHVNIEKSEFAQLDIEKCAYVNIKDPYNKHSQNSAGFVTVADDASYDIFGDGGANSPGINFAGIISFSAGAIDATSENDVALLYVQSGSISGAQHCTTISAGSNIEIDVLADDTAAALATTTDGKLGIQIGGGSVAKRFVRIYNRTGGSVTLRVHVNRFDE